MTSGCGRLRIEAGRTGDTRTSRPTAAGWRAACSNAIMAAHRVADQRHGLTEVVALEVAVQQSLLRIDRSEAAVERAVAEPRKVERQHVALVGELRCEQLPVERPPAETVHADERPRAGATVVNDANTATEVNCALLPAVEVVHHDAGRSSKRSTTSTRSAPCTWAGRKCGTGLPSRRLT